jgi:hypothetical protein
VSRSYAVHRQVFQVHFLFLGKCWIKSVNVNVNVDPYWMV